MSVEQIQSQGQLPSVGSGSLVRPITSAELIRRGGAYLAAARGYIQTRFRNGSDVTWGSDDLLEGAPITVRDIEELAAIVAAAAINDRHNGSDQPPARG